MRQTESTITRSVPYNESIWVNGSQEEKQKAVLYSVNSRLKEHEQFNSYSQYIGFINKAIDLFKLKKLQPQKTTPDTFSVSAFVRKINQERNRVSRAIAKLGININKEDGTYLTTKEAERIEAYITLYYGQAKYTCYFRDEYGIPDDFTRYLIKNGYIESRKIGKRYFIPLSETEQLIRLHNTIGKNWGGV
jgi:hypothetical protein